MSDIISATIEGLYVGQPQVMAGTGRMTAFHKKPVHGRVHVGRINIDGDDQADRRVHGGPERAVYHFPMDNYARLVEMAPQRAVQLQRGTMAENFSTTGFAEADVCIGDVFAFGTARIQVTQPRRPCWKIDKTHHVEDFALRIMEAGISGWHYRVLEEGEVEVGDAWRLVERNADPFTLQRFWQLKFMTRPEPDELQRLGETPGLSLQWQQTIKNRLQWLAENA